VNRPVRWLEITADYRCNNRCVGCFSVQDEGPSMAAREVAETLLEGRRRGATSLWLGGGEPTLRRDLFATVRRARALGYARVKLQTNGMLLGYPDFTERLVRAGVTDVSFSIKGATAGTHDRLAQTPGCHELMVRGMDHARAAGLTLEGDVLIYRSNHQELPEMVRVYHARGLERFSVWLLSSVDQKGEQVRAEVPRIADVVPKLMEAMDLGLAEIVSLHTPPCTVPQTHQRCLFFAADLDMLVTNPGGHAFWLEESPIEGGAYLEGCASCSLRPRCGGPRAEYVAQFGSAEFTPLRHG
jgi:MoaA/NifB/PqqE/SkfB family radical SAM enzyme